MFQTGIIKVCRRESISNFAGGSSIEKRLEALENKLANLKFGQDTTIGMQELANTPKTTSKKEISVEKRVEKTSIDKSKVNEIWKKVIENLKRNGKIRLYTALINTRINELNDLVWEVEFPNGLTSFNQKILENLDNQNELVREVLKIAGREIHLKYKDGKNAEKAQGKSKSAISDLGIDINIIE